MLRALLLAIAALSAPLTAAADANLRSCAQLSDPHARLACYDAQLRPTPPGDAAVAEHPATPHNADVDAVERFGAEKLPTAPPPQNAALEQIEARLVGRFQGWDKGTVFTLDNGQVWRSVDDRSVYYVLDQPAVTIRRGLFGGYWLKVEGLGAQARVQRVK